MVRNCWRAIFNNLELKLKHEFNKFHRISACKSSSYVIILIETKHDEGVLSGNIAIHSHGNKFMRQARERIKEIYKSHFVTIIAKITFVGFCVMWTMFCVRSILLSTFYSLHKLFIGIGCASMCRAEKWNVRLELNRRCRFFYIHSLPLFGHKLKRKKFHLDANKHTCTTLHTTNFPLRCTQNKWQWLAVVLLQFFMISFSISLHQLAFNSE